MAITLQHPGDLFNNLGFLSDVDRQDEGPKSGRGGEQSAGGVGGKMWLVAI